MPSVEPSLNQQPDTDFNLNNLIKGYVDLVAVISSSISKSDSFAKLFELFLSRHPVSSSMAELAKLKRIELVHIEKLGIAPKLLISKFLELEKKLSEIVLDSPEDQFCAWARGEEQVSSAWNAKLMQVYKVLSDKKFFEFDKFKEDPQSYHQDLSTAIKSSDLPKLIEAPLLKILTDFVESKVQLAAAFGKHASLAKTYQDQSGFWKWIFSPIQSFRRFKQNCNDQIPIENEIRNLRKSIESQGAVLDRIGTVSGFARHFKLKIGGTALTSAQSSDLYALLENQFHSVNPAASKSAKLDIAKVHARLCLCNDIQELSNSIYRIETSDGINHRVESKQIEFKAKLLVAKGRHGTDEAPATSVQNFVDTIADFYRRRIDNACQSLYEKRLESLDLKFAAKFGFSALTIPPALLQLLLSATKPDTPSAKS